MSVDYEALMAENIRRYGTDIGRIGKLLLADRYDKRTHFIYELLQNAEDALRRRPPGWTGERSVAFDLSAERLAITHHGEPFNAADVQGVCGIDESTKDITSIGRFGIGFKSVYSFTKRPEIHSGNEAFAIETFVWPTAVAPVERLPSQTKIILPLNADVEDAATEIAVGLKDLGPRTLLFLRHIKEVSWTVDGKPAGLYFRDDPENFGPGIRQVSLVGQQDGEEVEETWIVFSKEVANAGQKVGFVELAFTLSSEPGHARRIVPLSDSTLVVFFPTVVSTNTGFLIQGPFRTTPSRDNIPVQDAWNKDLVTEASLLLVEALRWMASERMLDVNALQALPIQKGRFNGNLLAPMYEHLAKALQTEPLLPCGDHQHAAAPDVQLARTQDLRELFSADQLGNVLNADGPVRWLSADITADRTPALRTYLIHELKISEQSAESLLPRLTTNFLRAQSDEWIVRLYEYLNKVPAVAGRLRQLALVRLEDGRQIPAFLDGAPQAFFPSDIQTGFPTIRRSICRSDEARKFLEWLGLTSPDPVDDVILNLLPVYQDGKPDPDSYGEDLERILRAFKTDSTTQRHRLIDALTKTPFVRARDMKTGEVSLKVPPDVSIKTARLSDLYVGIAGIYLTEDDPNLRGEAVRELLEACGSTRYIVPIPMRSSLTESQKLELRRANGAVTASSENAPEDATLRGLDAILAQLPSLSVAERRKKAQLLWDALIELQERRGAGVFSGTYRWQYYHQRSASFDAHFVRLLNRSKWITDAEGDLVEPQKILFEALDWRVNSFLQSRIVFKKPIVDELAKEAGFEPDMLDMLKKLGLTRKADLLAKLKVEEPSSEGADGTALSDEEGDRDEGADAADEDAETGGEQKSENEGSDEGDAASGVDEDDAERGVDDDDAGDGDDDQHNDDHNHDHDASKNQASTSTREGESLTANRSQGPANQSNGAKNENNRSSGSQKAVERKFVSYVATHPEDEDENDPDGLDHSERMVLEAKAIDLTRVVEPNLKPMPAGNEGFDLVETDANDEPERWVEVKAMKGCLEDRPVGLSSAQFEFARQHGDQYWLYIVEYADDVERARILKIKNPVGRTGTFTFDKGWASVAQLDAFCMSLAGYLEPGKGS